MADKKKDVETEDTSKKEEDAAETAAEKEDTTAKKEQPEPSAEKKHPKKSRVKKVPSDDSSKMSLRDWIIPICMGVVIACLILSFISRNGSTLKNREGAYTVYLNDDSLSKIGSYSVTSVKQKGSQLIYEGGGTKIIAENGTITIITPTEADSYTDAFILKDQQ